MSLQLLKKANLGYVLIELYRIDNDKTIALSDWRQRPLSDAQLQYGARDVLYLQAVAGCLIHAILNASPVPSTSTNSAAASDEEPTRSSIEGALTPSSAHQDARHSGKERAATQRIGKEKVLAAWKRSQKMAFVVYHESACLLHGPLGTTHHISAVT